MNDERRCEACEHYDEGVCLCIYSPWCFKYVDQDDMCSEWGEM